MIVTNERIVSLIYELRLDQPDGKIVESLEADAPLTFLYGTGGLLPKFEENIHGLKVGDSFDFNLTSGEAYGEINHDAIISIPISAFEVDGKIAHNMLKIGNKIPMQDSSGHKLTGVIKEVTLNDVKMDFNHPLAGNNLFFKGQITDVREATEEELTHGHAHGSEECGSCGSCGSCGDNDGHCC
jgi:FKBP-type peptidyl-prolyl cis-trans isomerase SlyD